MRMRPSDKPRNGFTLIELAVVMGVIGVVTAGLWRLSAVGNLQSKDQAAAQQQLALIAAVKGFLSDSTTPGSATPGIGGQYWLSTTVGAGGVATLSVPAVCPGAATSTDGVFCNYLPSGFTSGTSNPYGQSYNIQVVGGAAPSPGQGYSFMIVTSGGTAIPDADGGRIAALIGGDGGFIYKAPVCTAAASAKTACGTLGAWVISDITAAPAAGYKFAAALAASGSVASRTYVPTPSGSLDYTWLARILKPGDTTTPPTYNTMSTDMYMGNTITAGSTSIYFPGSTIPVASGGTEMYPVPVGTVGAIELGSSGLLASGIFATEQHGQIDMEASDPVHGLSAAEAPFIFLATGCTGMGATTFNLTTPCPAAVYVATGDIVVPSGAIVAENVLAISDARFKTNIHTIKNALDGITKINPVTFNFKDTGRASMGVTAQNLEKTYPELVSNFNGKKYVEYNGLIGPLIGAVQELKRQNDDLREQLRSQSERLNRLEQKNSAP